jgi:hypothetical protein
MICCVSAVVADGQ